MMNEAERDDRRYADQCLRLLRDLAARVDLNDLAEATRLLKFTQSPITSLRAWAKRQARREAAR